MNWVYGLYCYFNRIFLTTQVQNLEKWRISIWFRLAVIDAFPRESWFFVFAADVFWFLSHMQTFL